MEHIPATDLQIARAPLASLLSKSQKAIAKLTPGKWQQQMLQKNIDALQIVLKIFDDPQHSHQLNVAARQESLHAVSEMIRRTSLMVGKFAVGTSQATLQQNRLSALRIAEALLRSDFDTQQP